MRVSSLLFALSFSFSPAFAQEDSPDADTEMVEQQAEWEETRQALEEAQAAGEEVGEQLAASRRAGAHYLLAGPRARCCLGVFNVLLCVEQNL